jgi:hypothetical protein
MKISLKALLTIVLFPDFKLMSLRPFLTIGVILVFLKALKITVVYKTIGTFVLRLIFFAN